MWSADVPLLRLAPTSSSVARASRRIPILSALTRNGATHKNDSEKRNRGWLRDRILQVTNSIGSVWIRS